MQSTRRRAVAGIGSGSGSLLGERGGDPTFGGALTQGDNDEGDDDGEIGDHLGDLVGDAAGLEPDADRLADPEDQGGDGRHDRAGAAEVEGGQGDIAAAGSHVLVEELDTDERELGAAESGKRAGNRGGQLAQVFDREAGADSDVGVVAGGADAQTGDGAIEEEPGGWDQQPGQVGDGVLGEDDGTDGREVGEAGDRPDGQARDVRGAEGALLVEEDGQDIAEEAGHQDAHAEAGDDLVGAETGDRQGEQVADGAAGRGSGKDAEDDVAGFP